MASECQPSRHVVLIGINHTCSSVELRDRLIFPANELFRALEAIRQIPDVYETLILSTCNRMEIYAVASDCEKAHDSLLDFVAGFHGQLRGEFQEHMYYFRCEDAVTHLFDVASSLDSLIIGEYQILGQIKEAHKVALESGNTGPILNRLFQLAVTAGKRARAETKIGEGALSIASAAVQLARKILGKLEENSALIIGAGEMSELTVKHLKAAGIGKLVFANRTLEKSIALAKEFAGTAIELSAVKSALYECDVVISATASPHYILEVPDLSEAMQKRKNRPMFLIDIAAPRDFHPDIGKLYNVFLYNIDDLTHVTHENTKSREVEISKVRIILKEEAANYYTWFDSVKVRPLLVALRKQFEIVRDNELSRYSSEINALPPEAQEFVKVFADSLTNKMLKSPSKALVDTSGMHDGDSISEAIRRVFLTGKE